jgi:phosphate transport system permease protein
MTDASTSMSVSAAPKDPEKAARLKARYRAEKRFRFYGRAAIVIAAGILIFLLSSIVYNSIPAFTQNFVELDIELAQDIIDPNFSNDPEIIARADWQGLIKAALRREFPEVNSRSDKRELYDLVSSGGGDWVRDFLLDNPQAIGSVVRIGVPTSDDIDLLIKGLIDRDLPESDRLVSDKELGWLDHYTAQGRVHTQFAWVLFTSGDSREPEMAGLRGAFVGSLLTILVTLALSFPIGVMAAIYLEELAPKNRITSIIEVNINNLAAVPSIVFGLLGLAVFISFFQLPRSAPLVGGLVLSLMTLPTIIIATRASLASIPPSIREAALGVGASRLQVIFHHVLPLAMPGILTGTIIGLAQAAGETAPLLMIGMMAFIVDTPTEITSKATVLPAQIYMWANNPERAFLPKTSAAIVVLLLFLLSVNAAAIYFRKKFEKRW